VLFLAKRRERDDTRSSIKERPMEENPYIVFREKARGAKQ